MADATITTRTGAVPARDCALLEATDGDEYQTRLSSIIGVNLTYNEDLDTYGPSCSWSGRTITLHLHGMTDKALFIEVVGRL